jgi:hypothetical protein
MSRSRLFWSVVGLTLLALPGCGRPTLPGQQFRGKRAETSSVRPATSPLPKQPFWEVGPQDAKVRIVAFYPIDDEHKALMDLLKSLAKQYPGKVYVKYTDPRTMEGQQAFEAARMTVVGLMVNTKKELTINAKPTPYTVDFSQEMGRYWTSDDLKAAVAQEVATAYGKGAAAATARSRRRK